MKKLLLVVDMQNDFVSGALGTCEARAIEANVVKRILDWDGEILFTLDTHVEDYLDTQEGRKLPVPHCIAGTEGWSPTSAVWMALMEQNVADQEHMVVKDTFGAKDLPVLLHERYGDELEETLLIGLCTDICVISNALLLKAFFPEMRIAVDASCCAGVSPESHQNALLAMKPCQIEILGE